MMWRKKFLFLLILLLCGCAAILVGTGAGVGVAGYKYIEGALEIEYIAPYEKVWEATKLALKDANIRIEKIQKDAINAKIVARKADNTKVIIKLKNKPSGIVKMSIRVGLFGNEEASLIIKKAIDKRLGIKEKGKV
ncbi:MAG TPA: DUF3568 family protein [Candidatus Desulfofervidus auxilii]|uniref:DUF3568 family protein n=1 Tax=Desulfofervidus auxilii TaxID=1621989 RepID=A0A7C0U4B3_DESA2|nr:DUF3568 family protein [Candidatus Desulfofervidus auxilii]